MFELLTPDKIFLLFQSLTEPHAYNFRSSLIVIYTSFVNNCSRADLWITQTPRAWRKREWTMWFRYRLQNRNGRLGDNVTIISSICEASSRITTYSWDLNLIIIYYLFTNLETVLNRFLEIQVAPLSSCQWMTLFRMRLRQFEQGSGIAREKLEFHCQLFNI